MKRDALAGVALFALAALVPFMGDAYVLRLATIMLMYGVLALSWNFIGGMAGYPSVNPEQFRFLLAPAGLPAAVAARLNKALTAVMAMPDLQARLVENGFDPEFLLGNDARAFVMKEIGKWRQAVKDSGAKVN